MLRHGAQNVLCEHILSDTKLGCSSDLLNGMHFHKWFGCMAKAWKCFVESLETAGETC